MPSEVNPKIRERLKAKYGKRYAYENCLTIGYIAKASIEPDVQEETPESDLEDEEDCEDWEDFEYWEDWEDEEDLEDEDQSDAEDDSDQSADQLGGN